MRKSYSSSDVFAATALATASTPSSPHSRQVELVLERSHDARFSALQHSHDLHCSDARFMVVCVASSSSSSCASGSRAEPLPASLNSHGSRWRCCGRCCLLIKSVTNSCFVGVGDESALPRGQARGALKGSAKPVAAESERRRCQSGKRPSGLITAASLLTLVVTAEGILPGQSQRRWWASGESTPSVQPIWRGWRGSMSTTREWQQAMPPTVSRSSLALAG